MIRRFFLRLTAALLTLGATVCPADALTKKDGYPKLNKHKCIRCYCCQELCPKDAVILKKRK